MSRKPPRHHELPEKYLRGFCEPASSFIWEFSRVPLYRPGGKHGACNPCRRGVGVTALRNDGYGVRDEGGNVNYEYEKILSEKEFKALPHFNALNSDQEIYGHGKDIISEYIYLMWKRQAHRDTDAKILIGKVARKSRQYAARLARAGHFRLARAYGAAAADIESQQGETEFLRLSMIHNAGIVTSTIASRAWTVLSAHSGAFFVTCDSPVIFDRAAGLSVSPLFFPLSSQKMLVVEPKAGYEPQSRTISLDEVARLNAITIGFASHSIYAPLSAEWIHKWHFAGVTFPG